ncbi:GntR family transcriptional regulator [Brachybacterium sp. Z12]|uniref:GntR family transcriptional regulator n=1 Tax=Brachybacterium sp. Z12 TaxID=2759167 RepID=UPI0018621B7D|nr:GntR family transcriptional regulator [Brachybacterium sp. Z12]QNN82537.1 GntR family transcriptional regulator [Brachybacterium sp. Z12]
MAVHRQVLRAEVEELILERLLESRWAPGSRLSIDGLARDLEVSPTPVREAMVSLERSGLVEYVALRGYVVAPMLDAEQMTELLDARKAVEAAALDRAFEHFDALLEDLEAAHRAHGDVIASIEQAGEVTYELLQEHFRADWHFHQILFDRAENRYLGKMVETLRSHTHRMRQTWAGGPPALDIHEAYTEHGRILEKVRRHHQDGALQALVDHLDAVLERSLTITEAEHVAEQMGEPAPQPVATGR